MDERIDNLVSEVNNLICSMTLTHSTKVVSFQALWERAEREWFSSHTEYPSIEEIDAVIQEVRNGKSYN